MTTPLQKAEIDRSSQTLNIAAIERKVRTNATTPLTAAAADIQIQKAWKIMDALFEIHGRISSQNPENILEHETKYGELTDRLDNAITSLTEIKEGLRPTEGGTNATNIHKQNIRLPDIHLPTFTGKYEDWPSFSDLFTATIGSRALSGAEKLQYLKATVTGEAATLIKHYTVTDQNYNEAWTQLKNRYDNKREIIFSLTKRLISLPIIKYASVASIQSLLHSTMEILGSLKVLGQPTDSWDTLTLTILQEKLDTESKSEWAKENSGTSIPTFKEFQTFLEKYVRSLHARGLIENKQVKSTTSSYKMSHQASVSSSSCKLCHGREAHPIKNCPKFLSMKPEERYDVTTKLKLCRNCLSESHQSRSCQSKYTCRHCNKAHHSLLHNPNMIKERAQQQYSSAPQPTTSYTPSPPSTITMTQPQPTASNNVRSHTSSFPSAETQVLLKTAVVDIKDSFGNNQPVRVLLDGGSESSFITEACANSLGLFRHKANHYVTGIGQSNGGLIKHMVRFTAHSKAYNNLFLEVDALVIPKVTGRVPRLPCTPSSWPHLSSLILADPSFSEPGEIDVLLGEDVFETIMKQGRIDGPPGSPVARESIFGWVLSGPVEASRSPITIRANTVTVEEIMKNFWEVEKVPTTSPLTKEEKKCESHFLQTHSRRQDGRYVVRLPFNEKKLQLGSTYNQALNRLHHLERRFQRFPQYKEEYVKFMKEYQDLGHMERVPPGTALCYLPHHFVRKEDSTTTKLRVVFDGSAKSSTGLSLNDTLLVGPTIQHDLFTLLLRFRLNKIALKADIAKMYRQYQVQEEDANYQCILWRERVTDPIQEFRLLTITYGTASASYLATRCLNQLAEDEKETFPTASTIIKQDTYVDDLMSGANTTEEAIILYQQLSTLVNQGGMELRKWCSNDPQVMASIPETQRESISALTFDDNDTIKTLGIQWMPVTDMFTFKVNNPPLKTTTKRILLSELAKVFDPMGWLAPCTVVGKLLLQQLWKEKIDWDDPVPTQILNQWKEYCENIKELSKISINRFVSSSSASSLELHGFSDASEKAYAAAIYLKCVEGGQSTINLLAAKTKAAPLIQVSLPRLELCAAKLLTDLMDTVVKALPFTCNQFCWTDSTIVLRWISSSSRRWKTFVANRVAEIQSTIPPECWHHVRSEDNPADLPSRGISPSDLVTSSLWWNGPSWLKEDNYPVFASSINQEEMLVEERKSTTGLVAVTSFPDYIQYFSSWKKLIRSHAWYVRFIKFIRKNIITGPLTPLEIAHSEKCIIRRIQFEAFPTTHEELMAQQSRLSQLNPWIDQDHILRVGGRIQRSNLSADIKHPIILPSSHHAVRLIIEDCHIRSTLHGGFTLTFSTLRLKYWILKGRSSIRNIIRKCITCRKVNARTAEQQMGNLPSSRVTVSKPFTHSGVDFAGPFSVKPRTGRGVKLIKYYVAIFVCFSTKAVHLEPVSDLTTEAFLASFRRFVSRRGHCSHIYSDCGRNFIGAAVEIKRLLGEQQQQLQQQLLEHSTTWHFNPPSAPHQGGLWEAAVKSMKHHLKRVAGNTSLTIEQFSTLLCNIEACLNSRPLCPISSDPLDLEPLTPGHFLTGGAIISPADPDLTMISTSRLGQWQIIQQMSQSIWKRWSQEYISNLQQRNKWRFERPNLVEGDLVLIKDETMPPMKWKIGRIIQTHAGDDNLVRTVTVKTQNGEMKRPIQKLSLLLKE